MLSKNMDTRLNIFGAICFIGIILIMSYAFNKAQNDYRYIYKNVRNGYQSIPNQKIYRLLPSEKMPYYLAETKLHDTRRHQ